MFEYSNLQSYPPLSVGLSQNLRDTYITLGFLKVNRGPLVKTFIFIIIYIHISNYLYIYIYLFEHIYSTSPKNSAWVPFKSRNRLEICRIQGPSFLGSKS